MTDTVTAAGWEAFFYDDGFREVIPQSDLRPHDDGFGCWCEPFDEDGVCVHNSMDGRERFERGERKAS